MEPIVNQKMIQAAINVLKNEHYVLGESVYKFEEEFARYCGVRYAVSTNSGTDALHLSLLALGVKGRKVLTSPASFVATANAVIHAGAKPAFADINIKTYTMDPDQVRHKASKGFSALIPVHLYGYPADMEEIKETARRMHMSVVEDAAQAHGAIYKGQKVGSIGDAACFSFYPSKNMTVCGDGGMMVTNDERFAISVAKLRDAGRKSKYVHDCIGYTARLNTVNAAIGRVQLKYLDKWNERRREIARMYNSLLSDVGDLILPPRESCQTKPVYHLFVIRTNYRDKLRKWLDRFGIECGVHYPVPIHLQPVYQQLFNYRGGEYPNCEELSKTCLSIPMHPTLKDTHVKYVAKKIEDFFEHLK
jgi:perosamine synthetase